MSSHLEQETQHRNYLFSKLEFETHILCFWRRRETCQTRKIWMFCSCEEEQIWEWGGSAALAFKDHISIVFRLTSSVRQVYHGEMRNQFVFTTSQHLQESYFTQLSHRGAEITDTVSTSEHVSPASLMLAQISDGKNNNNFPSPGSREYIDWCHHSWDSFSSSVIISYQ